MSEVNQQPPAQNNNQQVQKREVSIVDMTLNRIQELEKAEAMRIPPNYSAANAVRAAALILADLKDRNNTPILNACTKESIANALLKMVVQGLNPMKRQCSFIAYGNSLVCQREYQGSIAVAKRYGLKSITANAIYDGEDFAFQVDTETGRRKILKHESSFDSYGGNVKGAYAIIEMEDGSKNVEIMNMKQIQAAWNQGPTKGQSPAHKNFPDQMACKTVINRAVKSIINSSDDADLFEDEPIQAETPVTAAVKQEIAENANSASGSESIGFEEEENVQVQNHSQQPEIEKQEQVIEAPVKQKTPF